MLLPAVEDLLHQGKIIGEFEKVPLQALMVTAAVYIVVNFTLSSVARWLERRQSRRFGRGPQIVPGMGGGPGGGDVAVVAAPIDADSAEPTAVAALSAARRGRRRRSTTGR